MMSESVSRRTILKAGLSAGALTLFPSIVRAEAYPAKPITIVNASAAGGGLDSYTRLVASFLSKQLGQRIVVENRPGASGTLGVERVVKAKPDGYTILFSTPSQIAAAPHVFPITYNPIADLEHVTMAAISDYLLIVGASFPANNWKEFIAYAKNNPGKIVHACPGVATVNHVAGELLSLRAGIQLNTVQYKSGSPAMADVLANQANMMIASVGVSEPYLKSGRIKPIMIMSKARDAAVPDVPTSLELNLKDVDAMSYWIGVHAPKGTPKEHLDALRAALREVYKDKDLLARMETSGLKPVADTSEQFASRFAADYRLYGEIMAAAKIKMPDA
jgi:tripartite-type tricarboxylate transporter receptor subunit TctC